MTFEVIRLKAMDTFGNLPPQGTTPPVDCSLNMKNHMYERRMIACPNCDQPNLVRFYVLDLVSKEECEPCGHEVEFRRPSDTRSMESVRAVSILH